MSVNITTPEYEITLEITFWVVSFTSEGNIHTSIYTYRYLCKYLQISIRNQNLHIILEANSDVIINNVIFTYIMMQLLNKTRYVEAL